MKNITINRAWWTSTELLLCQELGGLGLITGTGIMTVVASASTHPEFDGQIPMSFFVRHKVKESLAPLMAAKLLESNGDSCWLSETGKKYFQWCGEES